jgi:type I restriction enzyme M protein
MIGNDLVECVVALGKNLFYNSIMESCLLITNNNKPADRKGKVLFIDAREELKREKTISYLLPEHIEKIHKAYLDFKTEDGFTYVAEDFEILEKESSLNIPLYIKDINGEIIMEPSEAYEEWEVSSNKLNKSMTKFFEGLK